MKISNVFPFYFDRIALDGCTLELDLTLVDRISALLNPQPVCLISTPQNAWSGQASFPVNVVQNESKFDLKITSPSLVVKLR